MDQNVKEMQEIPEFANTHKYYEYSPAEVQESQFRKMRIGKKLYSTPESNGAFADYGSNSYIWNTLHQGQYISGLHCAMFNRSLDKFTTPEQREKWLPKS